MKSTQIFTRQPISLGATLTPMIDVVFLLLVFFLWTTSFQMIEYILPTELSAAPAAGSANNSTPQQEWDFDPIIIKIAWHRNQPQWVVNNESVDSLNTVHKTLVAVAQIKPDLPVIIDPEEGVPFGHVIDVYDISQLSGFRQIQFAVSGEI